MDQKCKRIMKPHCKWRTNRHKISKKRKLERRKIRRFIKRHRNSIMNNTFTNNSHISAFVPSKMNSIPLPSPLIGLPGCDWVLENYRLCQTWQQKQNNAVNKGKLGSLEYENEMLRQRLLELMKENHMLKNNSNHQPHFYPQVQHQNEIYTKKHKHNIDVEQDTEEAHYEDSDEDFEIDEDFKKFFEETLRHREELKKSREQTVDDSKEILEDFSRIPMIHAQTKELYERLYGEDGPMIRGMETALKLTFERNLHLNNPTMWPIIPLHNP